MSRTVVTLGGLLWLVGCGGEPETPAATEATTKTPAASAEPEAPEPPPLPKPLMRQAMHCCKNLTMEPVVKAYLALGAALADKDASAITAQRDAMGEALAAANLGEDKLGELKATVAGIDPAQLPEARKAYGQASELLVETVEASQAGALDLAIAYSRQADAHWLQEGVEPKSPYGDGIHSYSWGTREEVQAADAAREEELGNR